MESLFAVQLSRAAYEHSAWTPCLPPVTPLDLDSRSPDKHNHADSLSFCLGQATLPCAAVTLNQTQPPVQGTDCLAPSSPGSNSSNGTLPAKVCIGKSTPRRRPGLRTWVSLPLGCRRLPRSVLGRRATDLSLTLISPVRGARPVGLQHRRHRLRHLRSVRSGCVRSCATPSALPDSAWHFCRRI